MRSCLLRKFICPVVGRIEGRFYLSTTTTKTTEDPKESSLAIKNDTDADDIFKSVSVTRDANRELGFERWYVQIKDRLAKTKGPLWLGGKQPFPYNREFQAPPAPLTDVFKRAIWDAYRQDPARNSPRALSRTYRISIERIDGIIRLKMLEERMVKEQGFKVNQDYVQRMEEILAARTPIASASLTQATTDKDKSQAPQQKGRPVLVAVPEGSPFTFEDAARVLKKSRRPIKLARFPATDDAPPPPPPAKNLTIRVDSYEQGKRRFIFVDTTNGSSSSSSSGTVIRPQDRSILVRESSGELRRASLAERLALGRRVWGAASKDFVA